MLPGPPPAHIDGAVGHGPPDPIPPHPVAGSQVGVVVVSIPEVHVVVGEPQGVVIDEGTQDPLRQE